MSAGSVALAVNPFWYFVFLHCLSAQSEGFVLVNSASAAKRRHPWIDDLQSSSSADRTVGGIEVQLNSTIAETALHTRWRGALNVAAGVVCRPLDLHRLPMSN
jgi:hypothetical protein